MKIEDLQQSDCRLLAPMMGLDESPDRLWRAEELEAIFRHQMSANVADELSNRDPTMGARVCTLTAKDDVQIKRFDELFHHQRPALELLDMVKDFAKASRSQPRCAMPVQIATLLLYWASIATALSRCGRRITKLDDRMRWPKTGGLAWG